MSRTNDIRSAFLDFFADADHEIVASGPLVPHNDPTLLFTNAGMVQFKNVFTGAEKRPYVRAASSQKCVRAGGKHNDLDNVGYTARHHTFFEMLGNFSFGDYFKERAVELAWTLLTREFGLAPDRLIATVYHDDDEAYDLWRKISGLPEERIIRIASMDNFWMMGDTGPCGPCSEIFYDHGDNLPGSPPGSDEDEGDRFVEIWNLVFMQYDQKGPDDRADLPKPSIDTGMGLERIAAVLQGTHDNYEIDLFRNLIAASQDYTGVKAQGEAAPSHRVIADHLRASGFLMADGVMPSNEGRGYVLRRIMRRAMRHAHMLGAEEPLLHRLVPVLIEEMGGAYGELRRAEALITETLKSEEERFRQTLARGLKLLDEELGKLGTGDPLPGEVAFRLYDTYGFPLDLTQDVLRGQEREVDLRGFEAAMERQREEARKAWKGSGETATDAVWFDIRDEAGATEFLGYETLDAQARIVAIVANGERIEKAAADDDVALVLNQTPFYAESGGQVGDTGRLIGADGLKIIIEDTQNRADGLHVHTGKVESGAVEEGDTVQAIVEGERRARLRANHSATHILHAALRNVLGDHVTQKGSLVAPDRLRFDISHSKPLSEDEIAAVERQVNQVIVGNSEVRTKLMTPDEAIEAGALALFGEKYGDEVRVVTMGHLHGRDDDFSTELCGGTHVRRTGDIGLFKIVSQSAVSAGVRRLEALTGEAARTYMNEREKLLEEATSKLKTAPAELPARLENLLEERKALEQALAQAKKKLALGGGQQTGRQDAPAEEVNGINFMGRVVEGLSAKDLRSMVDEAKAQLRSGVAAFVAVSDGKAALAVGVTDDLRDDLDAVKLVRAGAAAVGGKGGGGRPDFAQAGGPDGANAEEAIEAIRRALQ